MCSRAHHRWVMMRIVSSSLNTSAARRLWRWEKRWASSSLIHWHHATRVHRASSTSLGMIASICSRRRILWISRSSSLIVGLSWISRLILHTHWATLTSYGRPYHRLAVLLIRIGSVLMGISLRASLILSLSCVLTKLLLWGLMISVSLSILSWSCYMSWIIVLSLNLTCPKLITCLFSVSSVTWLS